MLCLSCVSHFLIKPHGRFKATLHPMKLQSISWCVMNWRQACAKWTRLRRLSQQFQEMVKGDKWNIWGLFDHWWHERENKWKKERKKKRWCKSEDISQRICVLLRREMIQQWRDHPLLKIRHRQKTNFLPCQQKTQREKVHLEDIQGLHFSTSQPRDDISILHPMKKCSQEAFLFESWFDPWTKRYCCILVSAWQWLDFH